jgi:hypothetical protein
MEVLMPGKPRKKLSLSVASPVRKKEKAMDLAKMLDLFGNDNQFIPTILDTKKPAEVRAKMLMDVLDGQAAPIKQAVLTGLLQKAAGDATSAEAAQLKERFQQVLAELENGPVRPATFIATASSGLPGPKPKVHVITPDGQERLSLLHPDIKVEDLEPGMTVYLDPKGAIVLGYDPSLPSVGQEATFVRSLDDGRIEATLHEDRFLVHASAKVADACADGELKRGDRVLMCTRRHFAFQGVPAEADRRHRFVDRNRVPEVIASRDIGKPHWVLGYMRRRARLLLFRPDLLERYDLRPRFSVLMTGPTGCGKTLTIKAFLHEFVHMASERTGRDDLESRIIRVKVAELLSEWLGRSDKNIEELFDDIYSIASAPVETADGEKILLPVVVILEEVEGVGRRRGEHDAGVYDRIIGTLLQRLDDPLDELGKLPLILITTSNRPDLIDSAMWRRLSGIKAPFRRLDRDGLAAVLGKKLKAHYPYASRNGYSPEQLRDKLIDRVVNALFSPNGPDQGLIEITFRDGKKVTKHRRDFLTGAVIEQAVSNAIDRAAFAAEENSRAEVGLTAACLLDALHRHLDGLADNLTPHNVHDYLDLPENAHVANLRRLRQPNSPLEALVADEE